MNIVIACVQQGPPYPFTNSPLMTKARFGDNILSVVKLLATKCKNHFSTSVCIWVSLPLAQFCIPYSLHSLAPPKTWFAGLRWAECRRVNRQWTLTLDPCQHAARCLHTDFWEGRPKNVPPKRKAERLVQTAKDPAQPCINAFLTTGDGAPAACESDSDHPPAKKSREKCSVRQDWFTKYRWLQYHPLPPAYLQVRIHVTKELSCSQRTDWLKYHGLLYDQIMIDN